MLAFYYHFLIKDSSEGLTFDQLQDRIKEKRGSSSFDSVPRFNLKSTVVVFKASNSCYLDFSFTV